MAMYEHKILDPKQLPTIGPEGIVDLFFRDREFFVDVPLYIRTKEPVFFLDKIFVFKLIQPFDCEIIIAANSMSGGNWESLELKGDYESYKKEALEFVKSYIKKRVTKNKNLRVEVDRSSFLRETTRMSPFNGFVMEDELDMIEEDELEDVEEI